MQKSKLKLILWAVAGLTFSIQGQEATYISLEKALEVARLHNSNSKMAEWDKKVANATYHQTDAVFLPQVSAGYTAISTNNPLNAFGFLLNQAVVTSEDFNPQKLNSPGATQNYNANVGVKLPLFNADMIMARQGAKYQEEVYQHKLNRTMQYVDFAVKKAYYELQFSYQAKDVLLHSLDKIKRIHKSVTNFQKEGLVQESDVLNAQVQVNTIESALAKAKSGVINASDALQLLLGTDDKNLYGTDSLKQQIEISDQFTFSTSRSDVMAMDKALEATNSMVKSAKFSFLPRLNAFANYQLNDSKALGFKADSYMIGVNLSWTIFSGNQNRSKMRMYQYQRNKLQEERNLYVEQSRNELEKTRRGLSDLQLEINKHKISVNQASEALRILENRYHEGLVSTTDLLQSQTQFSQQELLLAQAVLSYNITAAYLEFLSETN